MLVVVLAIYGPFSTEWYSSVWYSTAIICIPTVKSWEGYPSNQHVLSSFWAPLRWGTKHTNPVLSSPKRVELDTPNM